MHIDVELLVQLCQDKIHQFAGQGPTLDLRGQGPGVDQIPETAGQEEVQREGATKLQLQLFAVEALSIRRPQQMKQAAGGKEIQGKGAA